jgi:CheY-like chemotaxis protein/HPt (histidine-containing phosphotransfer) domain-containing protein
VLLSTDLSAEQRDLVGTISTSGDVLLGVISNILDFSKIESGHLELENRIFDLRACVENALEMVSQDAAEKGLELIYLVDEEAPGSVVGDEARLRQVLVNLMSNAVKFTEEGEVRIHLGAQRLDQGHFELTFTVQDTGIGIPADRRDRLFRSFSQVDASTTRRFGGTGLGLVISKRLCQAMGGDLWIAESTEGVGSVFRGSVVAEGLPLAPTVYSGPSTRPPVVLPPPSETLREAKVLVAEDNPVNLKVLLAMLDRLGVEAEVARDGHEVLSSLEEASFDLVLMDIQMPRMDGLEAVRHIRERWSRERRPRLVAISASALPGDRDRFLEAGMDDYLPKPVRIEELARVLKRELEARRDGKHGAALRGTSSEPALIDREAFERLQQLDRVKDGSFLNDLVGVLESTNPERVEKLRQSLEDGDAPTFERLAHSFKGVAASLGADRLTRTCREMEALGSSGSLTGAEALMGRLEGELAEVMVWLKNEVARRMSSAKAFSRGD